MALEANESGHPVLIMSENSETHHFTQSDTTPTTDMAAEVASLVRLASIAKTLCRATVQIRSRGTMMARLQTSRATPSASRAVLAYNLLGPTIVVMMSGEEYNTDQVELPAVSRWQYGMNTSCQTSVSAQRNESFVG